MNGESDLPEGWAATILSNISTWKKGKKPNFVDEMQFKDSVPYIDIETFSTKNVKRYADISSSIIVEKDALLVVWDGARCGLIGRSPFRGALGSTLMNINPIIIDKFFLFYYIHSNFDLINSNPRGTGIPHVDPNLFWSFVIPLPPLAEQRRIVAAVEALLARVNTSRERLDRVPGLLKAFRQAVLAAACSGRLTEGWRGEHPDIEPASSIFEDKKNQKKIEKKGKKRILRESDNSVLIELPEKWLWVKWGLIGVSQNGRLFPSKEYQSEGVRLLRPGNLDADGKIIWTENNTRFLPRDYEKNYPEFVLRPNEIVMNLTAQSLKEEFLGRVCMTGNSDHSLLNQRLARLIPNNFSPLYTFWVFKSPHFRKFVDKLNTGSMIQHMFTSQLVEYNFPLPPLAEQHEIVRRVESLFALANRIEQRVAVGKERADRLTQTILAKAFRGELVPTEAELARREGREYEPASVLLERIRKERESQGERKPRTRKIRSGKGGE